METIIEIKKENKELLKPIIKGLLFDGWQVRLFQRPNGYAIRISKGDGE